MKVSFFEVCKRLSQLVAGAMDVGLYRPQREVQNFGDFLIGTPLYVPEQNAGSVLGPKRADGGFDGAAKLLRFYGVER